MLTILYWKNFNFNLNRHNSFNSLGFKGLNAHYFDRLAQPANDTDLMIDNIEKFYSFLKSSKDISTS